MTIKRGLKAILPGVGRMVKVRTDEMNFDNGISFAEAEPDSHVILFTGLTLPADSNLIRGIGISPARVSGWTAITGTVVDTPAQVYMDYRELHSAGLAEVLGHGSFAFMDDGASCKSLFAGQDIAEVDAGAVVLTAGGLPAVGIFGRFIKLLLNGETFNPGGVGAALFLSVQANVTDVAAEDVSLINMEVASGGIRSVLRLRHSAGLLATNFFELDSEVAPVIAVTGYSDTSGAADKALHVTVGADEYIIPLYLKTP